MSVLPFGELEPFAPRRVLPASVDWSQPGVVAALFDRLEAAASAASTPAAVEQWLLDWGEVSAAFDEEGSRRYIAMTCHTEDAAASAAYREFIEQIEPHFKPRQFRLAQVFLEHPLRARLPAERYHVLERNLRLHVELFRPENVPLETEQAKLGQEYQTVCGAMTVTFRGEQRTLPRMGRYLEETDRALRQEAWELVSRRRLEDAERIEVLFEQLLAARERTAAHAGFANYRDYAFRARGRFDYTPQDCVQFHTAIESEIMPLLRAQQERRRRDLGVATLRPWDLAVDRHQRPPLRPFATIPAFLDRAQAIFDHLDSELAGQFRTMRGRGLLDLENRAGKAPGGYQSTLAEARVPFIFMNAVGVHRDVETLLHEAGHAFHTWASRGEALHAYREAPIEFCEVASMAMELLGNRHLEVFYPAPDARRARREHLEGVIEFFPWMAIVDAFQHWIYTHPGHAREARRAAWLQLMDRFGGSVDWSGYETARAAHWHRQLHLFLHPFYYVEYGIAQLGALQIWAQATPDLAGALRAYRAALALGGSQPLPELFAAAGCQFDFSLKTIRPLVRAVAAEIEALE